MKDFQNKVAIITGGGSGIGRALCEILSREGAIVIAADINMEAAEQVAKNITSAGNQARAVHLDVTDFNEFENLINSTLKEFGRLDLLFNSAGIVMNGELEMMNIQQWHRIIDINLFGVINGSMSAYKAMCNQGFGHIVNIASAAGLIPLPLSTAYCTTKHGVVGFSASLSFEAKKHGIKVSAACPTHVRTNIFKAREIINKDTEAAANKRFADMKMMSPDECAGAILKGVTNKKTIIPIMKKGKIFWLIYRLFPNIFISLYKN